MSDKLIEKIKSYLLGKPDYEKLDILFNENGFDVEFIKKTLKKIMKNNPVVAMWIKNYSKTTKDRFGAIVCAVVVYRLLESQDEADFLNEVMS